jgi:hypothetical protein
MMLRHPSAVPARLLQQDRLAGAGRRDGDFLVGVVRRGDDDGIDVGPSQRDPPVPGDFGYAESLRQRGSLRFGEPDQHPNRGAAGRGETGEVVLGDESRAEYRDPDRFPGHRSAFEPTLHLDQSRVHCRQRRD